jgi:serine/threonine protein kinase
VPTISREELEAACEDFSNIIGSSSDSMVFKGTLTNGTEIAVTSYRIPPTSWTPNIELYFRRKVEALARMNHRNLVNLIAYCSEEEPFERMLVFEYAPNGTLFEHLHNKESEHLDWPMRMRIVMGAAYGLQYMHHELVPPSSHLNFDSNSVYLSEDYAAKVADFGISKLSVGTNIIGRRKSFSKFVNDEQCNDRHTPDFESNVFSFGVFLLETITARSNAQGSLVEYVVSSTKFLVFVLLWTCLISGIASASIATLYLFRMLQPRTCEVIQVLIVCFTPIYWRLTLYTLVMSTGPWWSSNVIKFLVTHPTNVLS